jgi:hypothetical protein
LGVIERVYDSVQDKDIPNPNLDLQHLFDRYPPGARPVADVTFIADVTPEDYVIITGDWEQKTTRGKKAAELAEYRKQKAIGFWLPKSFSGNRKRSDAPRDMRFEQAAHLIQWWPNIKWHAQTASPSDLFDVKENGKIVKFS